MTNFSTTYNWVGVTADPNLSIRISTPEFESHTLSAVRHLLKVGKRNVGSSRRLHVVIILRTNEATLCQQLKKQGSVIDEAEDHRNWHLLGQVNLLFFQ